MRGEGRRVPLPLQPKLEEMEYGGVWAEQKREAKGVPQKAQCVKDERADVGRRKGRGHRKPIGEGEGGEQEKIWRGWEKGGGDGTYKSKNINQARVCHRYRH